MKKASRKTTTKASRKTASRKKASRTVGVGSAARTAKSGAATIKRSGRTAKVMKQPQVKKDAAVAHGMFLYTDDAWSLRYFDPNDLHCKEREVFG